ncbi:ergothioneine biosynthesis glutamate--cysteine ligase EgtA [Streptomyces tubbatahanensis]|uniref:Glutamate--cysteine ligase EgtA n=1 Tax=Streptomyces tubbatahanensis TaxID=2923272 RepID=A0ABY3Y1D6_9ACTN|nr:ergothioneine biosynthesis glutamate--cysteine ligase EgtA [Streptomyces tubbatahanensis]UNT00407.1 ergothioneine biosynthesis glutamate--cysteine ligase EgtA [Streptomyces tubbatahanensis]
MTVIASGEVRELLTEEAALARVHGICFKTGPPRRVGVELEWLVHPVDGFPPAPRTGSVRQAAPGREHVGAAALEAAVSELRDLSLSSVVSLEPGGQIEFSSRPSDSLPACIEAVGADLAAARERLARHGMRLVGRGLDERRGLRLLDAPRYRAMEAFFDRTGPAGRTMMRSSASVQVCVDAGVAGRGPFGLRRRWFLAHVLGAVLTAAFANSPVLEGDWAGWRSGRQAVWAALDGYRNLSPAPVSRENPRSLWARHALDAPVLCVRSREGPWTVPGDGMTFRQWIGHWSGRGRRHGSSPGPDGAALRPPGRSDLDYHLTTLFPPVRPCGHLELRMIDAQSGDDGWIVPLAVTTALFDDAVAAQAAFRAVRPLTHLCAGAPAPRNALWERAARDGLSDPGLHRAAAACFAAALEALPRMGADRSVVAAVGDFTARYVTRGRCPADDTLDACGSVTPAAAPPPAAPSRPGGDAGKERSR